jgi:Sec-independent protein secretion pathway component TatC
MPIVMRKLTIVVTSLIGLFVALLAIPSSLISANTSGSYSALGSYSPLVSIFLNEMKSQLLPPGWTLIIISPGDQLETYVIGAAALTALIGSPLLGFLIFDRIIPKEVDGRRRRIWGFTMLATALIVPGFFYGSYLVPFWLSLATPFYVATSPPHPTVDFENFYTISLRIITLTAIQFALPVYVGAAVAFRRRSSHSPRSIHAMWRKAPMVERISDVPNQ